MSMVLTEALSVVRNPHLQQPNSYDVPGLPVLLRMLMRTSRGFRIALLILALIPFAFAAYISRSTAHARYMCAICGAVKGVTTHYVFDLIQVRQSVGVWESTLSRIRKNLVGPCSHTLGVALVKL